MFESNKTIPPYIGGSDIGQLFYFRLLELNGQVYHPLTSFNFVVLHGGDYESKKKILAEIKKFLLILIVRPVFFFFF